MTIKIECVESRLVSVQKSQQGETGMARARTTSRRRKTKKVEEAVVAAEVDDDFDDEFEEEEEDEEEEEVAPKKRGRGRPRKSAKADDAPKKKRGRPKGSGTGTRTSKPYTIFMTTGPVEDENGREFMAYEMLETPDLVKLGEVKTYFTEHPLPEGAEIAITRLVKVASQKVTTKSTFNMD